MQACAPPGHTQRGTDAGPSLPVPWDAHPPWGSLPEPARRGWGWGQQGPEGPRPRTCHPGAAGRPLDLVSLVWEER